ncbi:MAG: hypothetical protein WCJ31_00940 [Planctomycetia bacterium]
MPLNPPPTPALSQVGRWSLWTASFLAGCAVVCGLVLSGCSGGGGTATTAGTKSGGTESAKASVVEFLEAIKRGDDAAASSMLTTVARTKTEELGLTVAPPVNPSARYQVKDCELIGDSGDLVHVGTVWSDTDEAGQESSENIVWVVRLDPEGWRVVGMAMKVFDDMAPLLLNFEDPDDMIAKQEMVAVEMQRRAQAAEQAEGSAPIPTTGTTVAPATPASQVGQPAAATAAQPGSDRRR